MDVTRVYTDKDGETHFKTEAIEMQVHHNGAISLSEPLNASKMAFGTLSGDMAESWHTAPRKQAIIILNGEVDLEVSDGDKRRFGPGQVVILEDTTGKGHTTHSVDGQSRNEIWVHLE